jgi:UDP-N-acetyl-2-amino-2-deoxyglucuronate dehydrogenase
MGWSRKRFALVGAAGFVSPRHMKAIKDTSNCLVCALDPNDSVGVIDSYFPDADFFTDFERYDSHIKLLRRQGRGLDYVSICSPNHLHDVHIRHALHNDADSICEKPLVLTPWNLDDLTEAEELTGKRAYTILQSRLHPTAQALWKEMAGSDGVVHDVNVTYVTSRGSWYHSSWKGKLEKSGGIVTNIGIHLFDMLMWVFGNPKRSLVHLHRRDCAGGYLELEGARVRWFLSVNPQHLPEIEQSTGKRNFRSIEIDGRQWEFSNGFIDLHTESYEHILAGRGFGISDARPSIETVASIRTAKIMPLRGDYHPICKLVDAA